MVSQKNKQQTIITNATIQIVCDGWLKQPHLAQSDWTLGLGEAAHLLHIE